MEKRNLNAKTAGDCFVENPSKKQVSEGTKDLIDKLLLERVPLAGIARVTGVSERWLQTYVNKKYEEVKKQVKVKKKKSV